MSALGGGKTEIIAKNKITQAELTIFSIGEEINVQMYAEGKNRLIIMFPNRKDILIGEKHDSFENVSVIYRPM